MPAILFAYAMTAFLNEICKSYYLDCPWEIYFSTYVVSFLVVFFLIYFLSTLGYYGHFALAGILDRLFGRRAMYPGFRYFRFKVNAIFTIIAYIFAGSVSLLPWLLSGNLEVKMNSSLRSYPYLTMIGFLFIGGLIERYRDVTTISTIQLYGTKSRATASNLIGIFIVLLIYWVTMKWAIPHL